MQVSCFGLDWAEVLKRPTARAVVEEMLHDDIDDFAIDVPNGLWMSDSWMQHFEAAEELDALQNDLDAGMAGHVEQIRQIVCSGVALDELGICDLTEGCNFLSMSPQQVQAMAGHFNALRESAYFEGLSSDTRDWLEQWRGALEFCVTRQLGLIGHAG